MFDVRGNVPKLRGDEQCLWGSIISIRFRVGFGPLHDSKDPSRKSESADRNTQSWPSSTRRFPNESLRRYIERKTKRRIALCPRSKDNFNFVIMALNQSEVDDITSKFIENLAATEYASTLSLVSGGTTNLVFRGQLKQPYLRPSGMLAKTVIVKHCLPFARLNRNIPLDTTRAV